MIAILYDCLIFLAGLIALPLWALRGKPLELFLGRLGLAFPKRQEGSPSIWIHMVSMGEVKAMLPLYQRLRQQHPEGAFYLSTTTETGQNEVKRSFPSATHTFYLPLDHSFPIRALINRIQPDLLLLSEGDLWYNAMRLTKKRGGKVILVSGKLSARSAKRFSAFPKLSKQLFSQLDLALVQNEEHQKRIAPFTTTHITGNLKLANTPPTFTELEFLKLPITRKGLVLTLASTHAGEEEALLKKLKDFPGEILVVPRHPIRFKKVARLLKTLNQPNVHLIDAMGKLPLCFAASDLTIMGGSFFPGVGGHNIFEPIQAGIPVLFGPHMETQGELKQLVLKNNAGLSTSLETLASDLQTILDSLDTYRENARSLSTHGEDILNKTLRLIQK